MIPTPCASIRWNRAAACVKDLPHVCPPQDIGASGKRWPWHSEAEMVAEERPLRPAEPRRRPAGGTGAAPPQLCRRLLHPGRRAAARPPGGRAGDLVEQQPLPQRAAQRGDNWHLIGPGPSPQPANPDPVHGGHHGSACPTETLVETQTPGAPGPAQRCHCHTLLYGSSRRWHQPRFSRAAVHPVIIGVPLMIVQTSCDQSTHSFSCWARGRGALLGTSEASLSQTHSLWFSHADTHTHKYELPKQTIAVSVARVRKPHLRWRQYKMWIPKLYLWSTRASGVQ